MGRVFTWHEIASDRVPRVQCFKEAYDVLSERLIAEPAIVGALAFGSVVHDCVSLRSDFNCFIVYDHSAEEIALSVARSIASDIGKKCYVPISYLLCDTQLASTALHCISESIYLHLKRSLDVGLIKGEPLSGLVPIPRRQELEWYLRTTMHNLQQSIVRLPCPPSDIEQADHLTLAFGVLMGIAHKTLAVLGVETDDTPRAVRKAYVELMPSRIVAQFERLTRLDAKYTELVVQQILGPHEASYRQYLNELMHSVETIIDFVRKNLAHVATATR